MYEHRLLLLHAFLTLAAVTLGFGPAQGQTVIFVDASATGAGNGSSWADAYTSVQPALAAARPGDHLWVAAGTYTGQIVLDRFVCPVALYGGLAGTEQPGTFDLSDRDLVGNETVLDSGGAGTVIHIAEETWDCRIDGFTITTGGSAVAVNIQVASSSVVANNVIRSSGGGVHMYNAYDPTIVCNTIVGNGCGISADNSEGTIFNNRIIESGGYGIYLYWSPLTVSDTNQCSKYIAFCWFCVILHG